MRPIKVFLVAGEPSGDLLASRLMRALREEKGADVSFIGVGGETMQQEGLTSLFDIKDLAVMGFFEILPHLKVILGHIKTTLDEIERQKPDIVITVDSWSFSKQIHLGIKKRNLNVKHIHYVAPQVWAWKEKRARQIKNWVDHLLMLLPFEEKYFAPYGMSMTYVGHPVTEGGADKGDASSFCKKYGIDDKALVMTLLPGSRKSEIKYLLPVFYQVVKRLKEKYPELSVVIPTVKTVEQKVRDTVSAWEVDTKVVLGEKERYSAFAASRFAVAASGTVSLELAMSKTPHLIAYKLNAVTAFLARHLLKIKYVNLVNILADKEIIPELLQENCNSDKIVETVELLLGESGEKQIELASEQMKKLGADDVYLPSRKAAKEVLRIING